jgi:hypothetical protein
MNIELDPASGGFLLDVTGGNRVSIPFSEKGLHIIHRILTAERRAQERLDRTIGSEASPVQYMIERWLVEDKERKAKADAEANAELMKSLDFDL